MEEREHETEAGDDHQLILAYKFNVITAAVPQDRRVRRYFSMLVVLVVPTDSGHCMPVRVVSDTSMYMRPGHGDRTCVCQECLGLSSLTA